MYTQNINNANKQTRVVSFPNRDSISQMEALKARNGTNITSQKNTIKQSYANTNTTTDTTLLFSILLSITESDSINTKLFPIIAGVLLTL